MMFKLREEYIVSFTSPTTGRYCEVFFNPSQGEMRKIGKNLRFVALADKEELYVWNAKKAIHIEVISTLDLQKRARDWSTGEAERSGGDIFLKDIEGRSGEAARSFIKRYCTWLSDYFQLFPY